ncbi:hypothetical protein [Actinoplanes sp. NPDC049265]|uniref:hypothetical protein n=1 Tax=Actinoplanes sp. NPDC049265 TaxID=3363902 RepID=UPI00371CD6F3
MVTIARNVHSPLPEYVYEDESTIYVFSGYLVDDVSSPRARRNLFASADRDERPIVRSPGGIYSYVTVRRKDGQVCAGHSTPSLEPVHYAETSDGLHVGNSPLLVHVASTGMEQPRIDESFYLATVGAGAAIDGSTPFIGCYRVPPRSILINRPGTFGTLIRPAPRPSYGRYQVGTFQQRLDSVSEALIRAGSVLGKLPQGEIRVSGGKDSRTVAAALMHEGIAATPVNNNFPGELEGQIADKVARVMGHESCLRPPRQKRPQGDEIDMETRRKIAYTGGLPTATSLLYTIRGEGTVPGPPLIMGHAHLQRGGLIQRVRSLEEAVASASNRTVSPYLRPQFAQRNARAVREFANETLAAPGAVPQSITFHAYLQYVLSFQFQSQYAYARNWNPLITPMVDERFALLCEDIVASGAPRFRTNEHPGVIDLRNERVAMGVIESLAPSLLDFPLAGGRFRCDKPHRRGYDLRDPDSVTPIPVTREEANMVFNTRRTRPSVRAHLWQRIQGTPVESWGELTCRPEVWQYVRNPNSDAPEGESVVALNQFLWSLYGYALILGTDWWTELSAF